MKYLHKSIGVCLLSIISIENKKKNYIRSKRHGSNCGILLFYEKSLKMWGYDVFSNVFKKKLEFQADCVYKLGAYTVLWVYRQPGWIGTDGVNRDTGL